MQLYRKDKSFWISTATQILASSLPWLWNIMYLFILLSCLMFGVLGCPLKCQASVCSVPKRKLLLLSAGIFITEVRLLFLMKCLSLHLILVVCFAVFPRVPEAPSGWDHIYISFVSLGPQPIETV